MAVVVMPVVMHARHHDHARPDVTVVTMVVVTVTVMAAMRMVAVLHLHDARPDFSLGRSWRQRRCLA